MNKKIKYILYVVIVCIIIALWSFFMKSSICLITDRCEKNINEIIEITSASENTAKTTKKIVEVDTTINIGNNIANDKTTIAKTTVAKTTKETTVSKIAHKEKISNFVNCSVPANNTIKSYMDYRCITLKTSKQYKLQKSLAYTGDYGIRMVNDRYCVAVGSYYTTTIGQYIDIELQNGKIIKGILADCKSDAHTDSTNRINPNGSVVEFIVDTNTLNSTAKKMGDISYVNGWNSKIVNIKVYDKVEKF